MSEVAQNQRRIPLRRMNVINGSKIGGVLFGSAERPKEYVIVCHQCGRAGGTLHTFTTDAGQDLYYHADHAPVAAASQWAARRLAVGAGR